MKNPKLQAVLALALTFAALWGLLAWDPFRHLRDVFVNPAQENAKILSLFTDPSTQEVSDGQNPLESLRHPDRGGRAQLALCAALKRSRHRSQC
jgi:hypothetical protein